MKTTKLLVLTLGPVAMLALTSCSSDAPAGQTSSATAVQPGVPGGVFVETTEITANVTAVDAAKRKVTLVTPDGKKTTVKCGPEVVNFDQIHVGEQLKVVATEQVAVSMATGTAPSDDGSAALVALAPKGAKPGGMVAETTQVTAKITAIDIEHRKATLEFPDGSSKTFPVRPDIDMTKHQVGEEVVIRVTESLALAVNKL